jgi:hypothetical protein
MSSVPKYDPELAVIRADAGLSDDDWERILRAYVRLLESAWREIERQDREQALQGAGPAPQPRQRTRRLRPSSVAKWEAQWQAERDAEAES